MPTLETTDRLRALLGDQLDREIYLSTTEGAAIVGCPTGDAFIKWARRHKVPLRREGARGPFHVKKGDIDWALRVR